MNKAEMNFEIEVAALTKALGRMVAEVRAEIGNRSDTERVRVETQLDVLRERIAAISVAADRAHVDVRDVRDVTDERLSDALESLMEHLDEGLDQIGAFKELTADQIGLFATQLETFSETMTGLTDVLPEQIEQANAHAQGIGEEVREALIEKLRVEIEQITTKSSKDLAARQAHTLMVEQRVRDLEESEDVDALSSLVSDEMDRVREQIVAAVARVREELPAEIELSFKQRYDDLEEKIEQLVVTLTGQVDVNDGIDIRIDELRVTLTRQMQAIAEGRTELGSELAAMDSRTATQHTWVKEQVAELLAQIEKLWKRAKTDEGAIAEFADSLKELRPLFDQLSVKLWDGLKAQSDALDEVRSGVEHRDGEMMDLGELVNTTLGTVRDTVEEFNERVKARVSREEFRLALELNDGTHSELRDEVEATLTTIADQVAQVAVLTERVEEFQTIHNELRDAQQADYKAFLDEYVAEGATCKKEWVDFKAEQGAAIIEIEERLVDFRQSLDSLRPDLEKRVEDTATELWQAATGLRERIDGIEGTLTTVEAEGNEYSQRLDREVSRLCKELDGQVKSQGQASANMLLEIRRGVLEARAWTADGPAYPQGAFVKHHGGIWIATEATLSEPGDDKTWSCVVNGVRGLRVTSVPGKMSVMVEAQDSFGETCSTEMQMREFQFKKTWDPAARYKQWDVVTRDGHRWVALCDDPKGDPASSLDWAMFSMRGPQGKRGPKGEPPPMDEIVRAYQTFLDQGEGIPLGMFRGAWKHGDSYARADVATFQGNLYIAVSADGGDMPPGAGPTGMVNRNWLLLFAPPTTELPPNIITYDGAYVPNKQVTGNTQVSDAGWLAISNKNTGDRAAPIPSGPMGIYPAEGVITWVEQAHLGVAWTAHLYQFLEPGWWSQMEVHVPEITEDTNYRFMIVFDPNGPAPVSHVIEEPVLIEGDWTSIAVGKETVDAGDEVLIVIDALNSGDETTWQNEWVHTGDTGPNGIPNATEVDRDKDKEVRIHYESSNGSQFDELNTIIAGSTIKVAEVGNLNSYTEWVVNSVIDQGTYFEFATSWIADGILGKPSNGPVLITVVVPTVQSTKYVEVENHLPAGAPSWANVTGAERLGGVDTPGKENSLYGIRINFQPAYVSPDWDLLAHSP